MKNNLTIIIPFYNGHHTINRLLASIPEDIFAVIIVDDQSELPLNDRYYLREYGADVHRLSRKGYFTGAVNHGIQECHTDVLILNQDTWLEGREWVETIEKYRDRYAMIGERIRGTHPAFGDLGYIHGTFMFIRRDAIDAVGLLNEQDYPLWGSTAEYQWRMARHEFQVLPLEKVPGFHHERPATERFGSSIKNLLAREPEKKDLLVRTPPMVSVIVPCYNYGRYIRDCVNSLIGGPTCLGDMPGQTLQSFEIIIVDDASTDDSLELIKQVTDSAKGIRSYTLEKNVGTARALNYGIERAVGKYITFLSADDMRESDSLEKLVGACEQNPHSFAYDDVWLFHKHERIKKWKLEEYDFERLIWKNQIPAGILFPRQAWVDAGGYPAVMGDGREDWAFNIALGIKGWCGVHVKSFGYLYRREGQNRTERNTTESHRQRFLAKIMDLFPDIYKGNRPMACCGKGSNSKKNVGINSTISTRSMSMATTSLIGAQGMEKIEYLGDQMSFTVTGDVSQVKYTFGKDRPKGWVDKRDLGNRTDSKGFLSKRDRSGKWLYRLADSNGTVEPEPVAVVEVMKQPAVGTSESSATIGVVERNIQPSEIGDRKISPVKLDFPDPTDMTVEEIKSMNLNRDQWEAVYKAEMAGRNRKGAVSFIEELLANWDTQ